MSIRKHGNSYQAQVRLKGHKPESRSFPTQSAAKRWKLDRMAELRSGLTGDGGMTLGALLREYREVAVSSSHAGYIRSFLNACSFLDVPVSKITEAHWIAYRDQKLKTQTKHSYNRCLMPLRAAIRYAIEMKRWSPSVFEAFTAGKVKSTPNKRRKRLFKEDERELLACARNVIQDTNRTRMSYPVFEAIVTLLLETAMRVGEVMILTKRHVRPDGTIYLSPEETKTKTPRTVALSPRALSAIDVLRAASATQDLIPVKKRAFARVFELAREEAGLGNLHIHDLRHEALSRLSETGVFGPGELMAMSGHSNLRQLGDYIHARPELIRQKLIMLSQQSESPLGAPGTYLSHPRSNMNAPTLSVVQPTP